MFIKWNVKEDCIIEVCCIVMQITEWCVTLNVSCREICCLEIQDTVYFYLAQYPLLQDLTQKPICHNLSVTPGMTGLTYWSYDYSHQFCLVAP